MNAGFSNLDFLKKQLLAPAVQVKKTYDDQLAAIGLGCAAAFENFCNRKFARVSGDTYIVSADRSEFLLPRYPLESLTLIELKITEADGWQTLDQSPWAIIQSFDPSSGIVRFPDSSDVGPYYAQLRFTYTGGYFWETLEPDDANYPSDVPSGASVLPSDLLLAWLLQCKNVWQTIDPLGVKLVGGAAGGDNKGVPQQFFGDLDLVPQVKQMLGQYIRYQLT